MASLRIRYILVVLFALSVTFLLYSDRRTSADVHKRKRLKQQLSLPDQRAFAGGGRLGEAKGSNKLELQREDGEGDEDEEHKLVSDDEEDGTVRDEDGHITVEDEGEQAQEDVKVKKEPQPSGRGRYNNEDALRRLHPDFAPNVGHIVWCGKDRWFEFHHYISVLSFIKTFQPDAIFFHYENLPTKDHSDYNTWYWELSDRFPYFRAVKVTDTPLCREDGRPRLDFIQKTLNATGGVYLSEHTMLSGFPTELRRNLMVNGYDKQSGSGLIMAHRNFLTPDGQRRQLDKSRVRDFAKCHYVNSTKLESESHNFSIAQSAEGCITVDKVFFPKDIMLRTDSFGKLVRRVFYNTEEIVVPKPSYDTLIPNIAHIVWVKGGPMRFPFYLTCLTLIYIQEVEMVYIYGGRPPTGEYWEKIRTHPKVTYIYRTEAIHVFNSTKLTIAGHISDIWRIDFVYKYGGIYTDTDVVFTKKMEDYYMGYDAIGSFDWPGNKVFPDRVSLAPTFGKAGAKFYSLARQTWHDYRRGEHNWNGLRVPYKLWERQPDLLLIEPHLQVICAWERCHPTWYPNYHNGRAVNDVTTGSMKNWKQDTHAFHITVPSVPPEFTNESALLSHLQHPPLSLYAEVGKYVMEKIGLLKDGNLLPPHW